MSSTRAVRIHEFGESDRLRLETVALPPPAPGEVQLRHTAIGVNFIDVYERSGLYPLPLPSGLGKEAAGVVEALGRGVRGLNVGERVAYASAQSGAYAERRTIAARQLVKLPAAVGEDTAAAILLKGLTAHALLRRVFPVKRGHRVLIHAAAGGVGLLLLQWALHLGADVIALVGSDDKAELVRRHGGRHVLLSRDGWQEEVRSLTGSRGVDVVYDSVGKDTFEGSLASLRSRGMMVSYGNASGAVPPIAPLELARRGSLFLTRPILFHYLQTRAELARAAAELFKLVAASVLRVHIGARYPLADVAQAHRDLAARKTSGSSVLLP